MSESERQIWSDDEPERSLSPPDAVSLTAVIVPVTVLL